MDDVPKGELKQEYINAIDALLINCEDLDIMDFIFQMLQKIVLMKLKE